MDRNTATSLFECLASGHRLDIYRLLVQHAPAGLVAGEIGSELGLPPTNLSFHLKALTQAGLVSATQEGRFQRYRAALALMTQLIAYLTAECCQGDAGQCLPVAAQSPCAEAFATATGATTPRPSAQPRSRTGPDVRNRPYTVLFLCTGNSARSIIAEALMNHLADGRFRAYSAGSHPTGRVHPFALEIAQALGYPPQALRSKGWDAFSGPGAPTLDFVFTVCDNAAGETCPVWPGQPMTAHWGIEDPAAADGSDIDRRRAFVTAERHLRRRIELFLNVPLAAIDSLALQRRLDEIGRS